VHDGAIPKSPTHDIGDTPTTGTPDTLFVLRRQRDRAGVQNGRVDGLNGAQTRGVTVASMIASHL
jgi:hypothetical protein